MQHNAADFLLQRHLRAGNGRRTAIVTDAGELSYGQVAAAVSQAASYLQQHLGIEHGDRVLLQLPDCPELVYFFLAALQIGAVAVPINSYCTVDLLDFYLQDSGARALVTNSTLNPSGMIPEHVVYVDRDTWRVDTAALGPAPVAADDSAFWLYTSGSTGTPKAAIHRHAGISACAANYGRDVLGIGPRDRCYSASKLFFAYGLGNSLLFPFAAGAATILNAQRSDPDNVTQCLRRHRPTLFFAVPTLYQRLLAGGIERDSLASVRLCISAGEALPPPLLQRWQDSLGQPIYDGIGSTEAMHIFCSNRPGAWRAGSSGQPVAGYELQIVDAAGAQVARSEAGYLWVRGATLARSYWNREAANAAAFRGDWLATGDIYEQDADGYFKYLGRQDDVFKSSGQWVSPVEIEQALLACDGAREAAVVGVRDASGFTSAKAFVVLSEEFAAVDCDTVRDQIYSQLRRRLSKYKMPSDIQFLPVLPKTATGKVSRGELRVVQTAPRPLQSVIAMTHANVSMGSTL